MWLEISNEVGYLEYRALLSLVSEKKKKLLVSVLRIFLWFYKRRVIFVSGVGWWCKTSDWRVWSRLTILKSMVCIKVKEFTKILLDWCRLLWQGYFWSIGRLKWSVPKMQFIQLDEGLVIIEEAFQKAKRIVEGYPDTKFTSEEYMKFHAYPLSPASCKPSCRHIAMCVCVCLFTGHSCMHLCKGVNIIWKWWLNGGYFFDSFFRCVYTLCYKPGDNNKALLHEKFKKSLEETINSTVCGILFLVDSCYYRCKYYLALCSSGVVSSFLHIRFLFTLNFN